MSWVDRVKRFENRRQSERGKIKCGEREGMIEGKREREVREGRKGKGIIKSGLVQVYEHIVV